MYLSMVCSIRKFHLLETGDKRCSLFIHYLFLLWGVNRFTSPGEIHACEFLSLCSSDATQKCSTVVADATAATCAGQRLSLSLMPTHCESATRWTQTWTKLLSVHQSPNNMTYDFRIIIFVKRENSTLTVKLHLCITVVAATVSQGS